MASISLTCLFTGGGFFLLCDSSRGVQKVMIKQIRMHLEGEPSFAFSGRRLAALVVTAKKEVRESGCLVRIVQERILPFGVLGFIILSSFLTRLLASRCPPVVGLCGNCSNLDGHQERCWTIVLTDSGVGDFDLLVCRLHSRESIRCCLSCCSTLFVAFLWCGAAAGRARPLIL